MECAYKEIRKSSFPVINALIQLLSFCYKPAILLDTGTLVMSRVLPSRTMSSHREDRHTHTPLQVDRS